MNIVTINHSSSPKCWALKESGLLDLRGVLFALLVGFTLTQSKPDWVSSASQTGCRPYLHPPQPLTHILRTAPEAAGAERPRAPPPSHAPEARPRHPVRNLRTICPSFSGSDTVSTDKSCRTAPVERTWAMDITALRTTPRPSKHPLEGPPKTLGLPSPPPSVRTVGPEISQPGDCRGAEDSVRSLTDLVHVPSDLRA